MNAPRPVDPAVSARLHARLETLARITDEPGKITRGFLSPAMIEANAALAGWCRAHGLDTTIDAVGNLRARWRTAPVTSAGSTAASMPVRPFLAIGSHLDTVRDAGRYDGPLGVVAALACVEQLQAWGVTPPFDIEVVAFSDEEGLRFQTAYLGSAYYAGVFRPEWLTLADADGHTLAEVLSSFGTDPKTVASDQRPPAGLLGYLEMHIEQGPVLEAEGCSASVVSAIAAQTRAAFTFTGKANHAGTTPAELRQDALCAAAETILRVEKAARDVPMLRATVGQIRIEPGASNVIPSLARISLDLRHPENAVLANAIAALRADVQALAARRRVQARWEALQQSPAVPMDPSLRDALVHSTRRFQDRAPVMVSGAGHDGVMVSRVCPVAMLFVRCREGLSHHPDEYAAPADIDTALAILVDAVAHHAPTSAA